MMANGRRREGVSSVSDGDEGRKRRRSSEPERSGERSFTPEIPTSSVSCNTSNVNAEIIELINNVRRERPRIGMTIKDTDINEFNPLNDDMNEWLGKIDEYAAIYNWDDLNTCHLAINKLGGSAEIWYKSLSCIPKTWAEWKVLLRDTFPSTRDLHSLMSEMLMFHPKPDKTLFEYCFEKLALIKKMNLNLSGADEVNLIVGGLNDCNIKFAVKAANIDDPSKLAVYLRSFEPMVTRGGNQPTTANPVNIKRRSVEFSKSRPKRETLCYICRQPGHKQANCPQNAFKDKNNGFLLLLS